MILTLRDGLDYDISGPASVTGSIVSDAKVSLVVSPASVLEGGTDNLVYTFTRTGVTGTPLTVSFGVGGTASYDGFFGGSIFDDYKVSGTFDFDRDLFGRGSVTIPVGQSTASITLDPIADDRSEPDETVILTLRDGLDYDVVSPASVTGTIEENHPPVANDDEASTDEDVPAIIAVLANDTDSDGDHLIVTAVGTPAHGSSLVNPDGTVTYTPALNYNGVNSFTYTIADGKGGVAHAMATITVRAVNDAPVNAVAGAQVLDEDTSLTFSSATGNAISTADVDAGTAPVMVHLSVGQGTLTLGTTAGLTFISGDGTADAEVTFTGTVTAVNEAMQVLVYVPNPNVNGLDVLTITTDDQGNTGLGGPQSDTDTVALTIRAVNDAPVNTVPGSQTAFEDVPLTLAGISIADVDAGAGTVQVVVSVGHGTLSVADSVAGGLTAAGISGNGTASVVLTGTLGQINATLASAGGLVYLGALNFGGFETMTITTNDLGNTGLGGPLIDTDTIAIHVLSAAEQATLLAAQVDALVADGTLNKGQGNSLHTKLDLKGNAGDAGKVNAFINEVQAYLQSGKLSENQASQLLGAARILLIGVSIR